MKRVYFNMGLWRRRCERRFVLRGLVLSVGAMILCGCKRSYVRPGRLHDLGEVTQLLYPKLHIRSAAILVHRDERGWAALSTNCSYDGCNLTFQDEVLSCACCLSRFSHFGVVVRGPASLPLPWFEMKHENGHLYADSGKRVHPDYRFSEPELEELVADRLKRIAEGKEVGVKVPDVLLGKSDDATGPTLRDFTEENLDEYHRLPSEGTTTTFKGRSEEEAEAHEVAPSGVDSPGGESNTLQGSDE